MNKLPKFRKADVVIQDVGGELLIYDLKINKAYNLNETSKIVYQACDGVTTFDELKSVHNFTDDLIFLALDELKRINLLENSEILPQHFGGLSRREAVKRVGFATMLAIPVITGLAAPSAAQTASGRCVGVGTTLNGEFIPSGPGGFVCEANPNCIAAANGSTSDACCSGNAEQVPGASVCSEQGTDSVACRCIAPGAPPPP